MKLFKDWASARNHHSSLTIKMVLNDILTDTTLQLLEVVIHHGEIKSSKCSRSIINSLPLAKRFDFTMVDDDFEELQRAFYIKSQCEHKEYRC